MTPYTIAVKTYRRSGCLDRLLRSLVARCPTVPVLVGDDSPSPYPEACSVHPLAEYLRLPAECGISQGRNLLADELLARGVEYMVLMDDDFEATPSTDLNTLVSFVETGLFDVAGGALTFDGGALQHCEGTWTLVNGLLQCKNLPSTGAPMATEICFNFFAARVETVAQVRWDPADEMGEHWEIFFRFKEQGVRVGYVPAVVMNHAVVRGDQAYDDVRWEKQKRCHAAWMKRRGITQITGGFNP